ncbi:uncharacterized protein LOC103840296 isoform X2 [Brassica rapa]|uniref:uncharacterized protein LOC103831081 isoform X2 n=1 Tax=Brassica campestris TaxID=3711 RepID=UPI00142E7A1A|nr:uncharacterized protein LOC103831081 isoform X2 [Brassica rapa]XP_033130827.1 uncharacterized protein LOC103831081 isoform X2 [Brassica rapa]XP_033135004.1 uncharacterized protein LOC103840296 isoform X2 [Brassica rapa]XP_033135005.1 uncharacterized protein LOC103840296 isoform X2 [Brassica rapa]
MINSSTTVSLSVFDAQADQLKQNILAIGVAKVIVATSINPKFVGGNIRCGKGRLYLDATSGIHFYFDHEVAASQRLFQELYSKPEKDTTSAKQYHGVKKLEKVSLGELNNYVLESPPQVRPLSFYAKPRSHHWKLQTDGDTSPVLNAPRSSSEGTLHSHALHVLMPVLLELSGSVHISILNLLIKNSLLLFVPTIWKKKTQSQGIVLSCWCRRVMINLSL